jgi:hypothetical protein
MATSSTRCPSPAEDESAELKTLNPGLLQSILYSPAEDESAGDPRPAGSASQPSKGWIGVRFSVIFVSLLVRLRPSPSRVGGGNEDARTLR